MLKLKQNKIIALSGLKGAGKDEAANMLHFCLSTPKWLCTYKRYKRKKKFKSNWIKISFARPLKAMLAILLDVPIDKFEDRTFKEHNYVDFHTLKIIPEEYVPDDKKLSDNKFSKLSKSLDIFLDDYYISIRHLMQYFGTEIMRKFFLDKIWINSTLNRHDNNIIITDLRFKAEADAVKERDGIIIYINRDGCSVGTHPSEREVIEMLDSNVYDLVIDNNSTLEDLFNQIKKLI